jgi:hypothetical protein
MATSVSSGAAGYVVANRPLFSMIRIMMISIMYTHAHVISIMYTHAHVRCHKTCYSEFSILNRYLICIKFNGCNGE